MNWNRHRVKPVQNGTKFIDKKVKNESNSWFGYFHKPVVDKL